MFDGVAFGKEMVGIVKGHVERSLAPLLDRLSALENREQAKSITVDDLRPMISAEVSAAIAAAVADAIKSIPVPNDGAKGKDGLDAVTPILKDGVLLFTMSDGSIREVGEVKGKDGQPGRDGVDGLGFDDLSAEYDGERGIVLRFVRGEQTKEFAFTMPVIIDRGVWSEGKEYVAGDAVTWAGSVWIAQKDTSGKPDGGDGWRLSVKRGRDGKDGRDGEQKAKQPIKVG